MWKIYIFRCTGCCIVLQLHRSRWGSLLHIEAEWLEFILLITQQYALFMHWLRCWVWVSVHSWPQRKRKKERLLAKQGSIKGGQSSNYLEGTGGTSLGKLIKTAFSLGCLWKRKNISSLGGWNISQMKWGRGERREKEERGKEMTWMALNMNSLYLLVFSTPVLFLFYF